MLSHVRSICRAIMHRDIPGAYGSVMCGRVGRKTMSRISIHSLSLNTAGSMYPAVQSQYVIHHRTFSIVLFVALSTTFSRLLPLSLANLCRVTSLDGCHRTARLARIARYEVQSIFSLAEFYYQISKNDVSLRYNHSTCIRGPSDN